MKLTMTLSTADDDGEALVTSSDNNENQSDQAASQVSEEEEEDDGQSYESDVELVFDSSKENDYKIKYQQNIEEAIDLDDVFVLKLDAQKHGQSLKIATALSNNTCMVYDFDAASKSVGGCLEHNQKIVDVKIALSESGLSSMVYTGSEDGTVKLWDLRLKEKCVTVFKDYTESILKPLVCFDISFDGRFIAAGTTLVDDDSYMLFWDVRSTNLLGGYWDTHQEDITQIKFHPSDEKYMISGSTDGIINLFDITQLSESDALLSSYNTNSSVSTLRWLQDENHDSVISCITHTEDVQLWHTTDSSPYITFDRDTIGNSMNVEPDKYSQVIDCHQTDSDGKMMLLVGTNCGDGEHLQSLDVSVVNSNLSPRTLFKNNKQIVRCSWYDYDSGILITGGEACILNIWAPVQHKKDVTPEKCSLKELPKVSLNNRPSKPY